MISRAVRFALCLFTLPALLGTVLTQKRIATPIIPPEMYSAMRWRMMGPHRGGRVLAVSGVRGHPDTFYFGAVCGGVWKTTDAGHTWAPIFDDQPAASIGDQRRSRTDRADDRVIKRVPSGAGSADRWVE